MEFQLETVVLDVLHIHLEYHLRGFAEEPLLQTLKAFRVAALLHELGSLVEPASFHGGRSEDGRVGISFGRLIGEQVQPERAMLQ